MYYRLGVSADVHTDDPAKTGEVSQVRDCPRGRPGTTATPCRHGTMTAEESTPRDGENVSEEQSGEPVEKPQTPKEAKVSVPGGSGFVRAEKRVSDTEIQVVGSSTPDENEPEVSVTVEAAGLNDTVVTMGFTPAEARELAGELREQATHAEQWAAYKREQDAEV